MADRPELTPVAPVFLVDLFPPLDAELVTLLRGLAAADWGRPTACALWSVKDIVAHLLDGCLRRLSFGRDGLDATPDRAITSYADLVRFLNELNAVWVSALRRLSPGLLTDLTAWATPQLHAYFRSLDPQQPARFAVAWAGEEISPNWFDIGREYTERWLHQQQIRDAVGAPGLNAPRWLHPVLDIFVRALPFTYRQTAAEPGTMVQIDIAGPAGGTWSLRRGEGDWSLYQGAGEKPAARVSLDQGAAWKLFSKALSPEQARRSVRIEGDKFLGEPLLGSLAIMA
jgi:uncharacterized protein (TIGR03083 family)